MPTGYGRSARRAIAWAIAKPVLRLRLPVYLVAMAIGFPVQASIELAPPTPEGTPIRVESPARFDPAAVLRAALVAERSGDWDGAEASYRWLSTQVPAVADYADLFRMRLAEQRGDPAGVIAIASAWSHSKSPLLAEVREQLGDALAAGGDGAAARRSWTRALEADRFGRADARLHRKLAESYEAGGDRKAATAAWLVIWVEHPKSDEAGAAVAALDRITEKQGVDPRTANHYRERGNEFFRRHDNEAALADYDRALASGALSTTEVRRARVQRAHSLFRLRRYPDAVEAYGALPKAPEYLIERARAIARAGDPAAGASELEVIARTSSGANAARATFLAGLLWDGEGETEKARKLFERVMQMPRSGHFADVALWNFGWTAFRDGRPAEAEKSFGRLLARNSKGIGSLRARYWRARARAVQGDSSADAEFVAIAREFPLTYYGWRARLRVDDRALPPEQISRKLPLGVARLDDAALERPRILLEAGLEREGRLELDRLYPQAESLADRLALSDFYAETGDYSSSQRLIVQGYTESLSRGPIPERLEMWWYAWPAPFAEDMRIATADGDTVEPGLVYAVMREESGYRPSVVSVVGARGLLQIMPETGQQLAESLALPSFHPDDLFTPEINIRLGSHYLATLLERFDGQASAAIASYNAGPTAVARWIDRDIEDDEWVEAIPYDQTREYVKRVLRSLYAYRLLY